MRKWRKAAAAMVFCLVLTSCGKPAAQEENVPQEDTGTETESGGYEPGENGEVVISHWGGSTAEAYRECYFNDFEKETGIKVIEVIATNNKSQLQAMVDTDSVEVDIMQGSLLELN